MEPRQIAAPPAGDAWARAATPPSLGAGDVHVWRASVEAHSGRAPRMRALLDDAERARADRFHFERDRLQFTVAHGLLRSILARYLGRDASALRFEVGQFGKPALAGERRLAFNLSHSGDLVLLAVTAGGAVGVDVERWSPDVDAAELTQLAESFFSPAERDALAALPAPMRREAFFACWSRKEAYIKATGLGVSSGLDYFDVSLAPGAGARLLADRSVNAAPDRWTLCDLSPAPGYSGAVAVDRAGARVVRLVADDRPTEPRD